jgi:ribonuclease-3
MTREPTPLETALGHVFARPALLREALTHASASEGRGTRAAPDNERLEFLGDRVLGLVVADHLLKRWPDDSERELALRFNAMVSRTQCARVARRLDLGRHLVIGRSEETTGGRDKDNLLADAVEALIAAVFADAGLEAARAVVHKAWGADFEEGATLARDAKSTLQHWVAVKGLGLPHYREIGREGPDHAPVFTMAVDVADHPRISARASSKQEGERLAAQAFLDAHAVDADTIFPVSPPRPRPPTTRRVGRRKK